MPVNIEHIIQKSNDAERFISSLTEGDNHKSLISKVNVKTWSVLQIVEHLNNVYAIYFPNFDKALQNALELDKKEKTTLIGTWSRNSMRPKGEIRKWKMKTFDFFEPHVTEDQVNEVFIRFENNKKRYRELLELARTGKYNHVKVVSSLGKFIKFYVPECLDFLMAHEERHVIQIKETLEKVNSLQGV